MQYGLLRFDEPKADYSRKIIHIDMDAFYASVEVRDRPELKGKPVIIARHPKDTHGRGVVTTASYEARQYGVHSAMSAAKAFQLCPQAIFIPARHDYYRQIAEEIRQIFQLYTDLWQAVSVDEAYLDVTDNKLSIPSATILARKIQKQVYKQLQLTCSAGVSFNKFIAKLASDYRKPAGLTTIDPDHAQDFLLDLSIENFHGVGKKTVEKMHQLGIHSGKDLYQWSEFDLIQHFGKMGRSLYRKVRAIDHSPVEVERQRKSCGKEHTFGRALSRETEVIQELRQLSQAVMANLKKEQKHGKTVVLKIRNSHYETLSRRKTLPYYVEDADQLFFIARQIWEEVGQLDKGIRLLGITVSSLDSKMYENLSLALFDD